MATFEDLVFVEECFKGILYSKYAKIFFPNGYGASVVTGTGCYISEDFPYELAVLKGTSVRNCVLCYDTPITDNVIGYLSESDVTRYLSKIEKLEPVK